MSLLSQVIVICSNITSYFVTGIVNLLHSKGTVLVMPPFKRGGLQFSDPQNEEGYKVARLRIHIERAIQRMKVFQVLNFCPHYLRPVADKMLRVIAFIANNGNPLIAEDVEDVPDDNPQQPDEASLRPDESSFGLGESEDVTASVLTVDLSPPRAPAQAQSDAAAARPVASTPVASTSFADDEDQDLVSMRSLLDSFGPARQAAKPQAAKRKAPSKAAQKRKAKLAKRWSAFEDLPAYSSDESLLEDGPSCMDNETMAAALASLSEDSDA